MECIINGTVLIIPEGTKKIGFLDICSYVHNDLIEEILLPSTLEVIEENTFFDLTGIKRINIPESVIRIGSQAFWGLDQIKELIIPNTVKQVGKFAFCNIPKCKLVIVGEDQEIPKEWEPDFAANVKEICFISKAEEVTK